MDQYQTIAAIRGRLHDARANGQRLALVPTMGYLHAGHMALVARAREAGTCVVLSVFVNPLQFGANEDLGRYPRDLARDADMAGQHGVDVLFAPPASEMYSDDATTRVTAGALGARWEGAARPGHFDGVLTVVAKLFNIVAPDVAWFGQKDIQQVTLVRRMVHDLDFPVRIGVAPIVRDDDGLALSSRNMYLDANQRVDALGLSHALRDAESRWQAGERDAAALQQVVAARLHASGRVVADYIAVVDPHALVPVSRAAPGTIVAIAARVGSTRLIDNIILQNPDS